MLCLDKLKIVTNINYIDNINTNSFITTYQNNELISYKYKQTTPCSLIIRIDYRHNELIIEFTSKILKDRSVQLINQNNIRKCLDNISKLGLCNLDISAILNDAEVLKCDVTKDINWENISDIANYVNTHIKNNRKWVCKPYKSNIVLENVVSTPKYKKRLTIYHKQKELSKCENTNFLNSLADKSAYQEYYKDKIRFELNLTTKEQIRKSLNIANTTLSEVLSSTTNPILNVLDEILDFTKLQAPANLSLRDSERMAFLLTHNNNLQEVERKIRTLVSSNTSINKTMKPYRKLLELLHQKVPVILFQKLLELLA